MQRLLVVVAAVTLLAAGLASTAGAYGGGAGHDTWQVGLSFNCNNPSFLRERPRRLLGMG
jgi:hypothetical protein